MIRKLRYWIADKLEALAYAIEPKPSSALDIQDIITHIEPMDTPFLRSIS